MGGSGGTYSAPTPSRDRVRELIEQAGRQTEESSYESEVNRTLNDILRDYNDRNVDSVRRHLDDVKQALESAGDGTIDLRYGGSIRKHTYVDGLSDVDVLAILNRSELANMPPQAALNEFALRLRRRFPETSVTVGRLAVTITYSDGTELQVLPALRTDSGLRIARSLGEGWSKVIRPDAFAQKLTSVNNASGGTVVPTIKLFKALFEINSPTEIQLSGYHAESLAIEAFKNYSGSRAQKDMLLHLCRNAARTVQAPIQDRTGQSLHVDDYLGEPTSTRRRIIAAHLERLTKRIETADRGHDADTWRELFGDE